jgi:uncharacterized protein
LSGLFGLLRQGADFASMSVDVVSALAEVPSDRLKALSAGRTFYVSPDWLSAVEAIRAGKTAYLICRDSRAEVIGVLPVYWGTSGRGFYSPYDMFLAPSGGRFQRSAWSPTYVVGSRFAYACEFLVEQAAGADARRMVLTAMLARAVQHAESVGASSLSALYLNERGQRQLSEVVGPEAFFLAAANAVVDLTATNFNDYALSLGSKRAVSIRHERRVFTAAGYEVSRSRLSDVIDEIAALFAALERKYGHDSCAQAEAKELRLMARTCDRNSQVLTARRDGRAVGAVLLFMAGDTVYVRSTGFDYEIVGQAFEYFNLVYYEVVEFALARGYQKIEFGVTAYLAKLTRGAHLHPLLGFVESWSEPAPASDSAFADWTARRKQAVTREDVELLRKCGLT